MKKLTWKEAIKVNENLGLETWEDDDKRLYWASTDDETAIWSFDSAKERNDFVTLENSHNHR